MDKLSILAQNENEQVISTIDLREKINELRELAGDNAIRNDQFLVRVEDEIGEDIGVCKSFTHPQNKTSIVKYYDLTQEQALLVGMRESKAVRRGVLEWLKDKAMNRYKVPQNFKEALVLAVKQQEIIEEQAVKIESDRPKVLFAEAVKGSSNDILVREFAKVLTNKGFKIGQNTLYKWFRDNGYLNGKNEPYQQYSSQGLFEVIQRVVGDGDSMITVRTTKITGKGQIYFSKKLIK